jgi:hypothetical protein
VGADVAVGRSAKTRVKLRVDAEHDLPARAIAAFGENGDDLALALIAMLDVGEEAFARIVHQRSVTGTDDAEVRERQESLKALQVQPQVPHGCRAAAKQRVAGKEHSLGFEVITDGVFAVSGRAENLKRNSPDIEDTAVLKLGDTLRRQLLRQQRGGPARDQNFSFQVFANPA